MFKGSTKDSKISIKLITAKDTYSVRHPVLRKGRPIEDCAFENDDLESTFHFGLFYNDTLVGVATFLKSNNALFKIQNQYQLRGMAILKDYQGLHLGDTLLKFGEHFLKSKNIKLLWFNAREIAVGFYKKNNYVIFGEPFDIKSIGLHYLMHKQL